MRPKRPSVYLESACSLLIQIKCIVIPITIKTCNGTILCKWINWRVTAIRIQKFIVKCHVATYFKGASSHFASCGQWKASIQVSCRERSDAAHRAAHFALRKDTARLRGVLRPPAGFQSAGSLRVSLIWFLVVGVGGAAKQRPWWVTHTRSPGASRDSHGTAWPLSGTVSAVDADA